MNGCVCVMSYAHVNIEFGSCDETISFIRGLDWEIGKFHLHFSEQGAVLHVKAT